MLVSEGSVAWYDMTRSKLYKKSEKDLLLIRHFTLFFSELCSTGNMFYFLLSWAKQGVLLIDAALTVKESQLNLRHCNIGDDKFRGEKPSHRHASLPDFLHTNKHRDLLPWLRIFIIQKSKRSFNNCRHWSSLCHHSNLICSFSEKSLYNRSNSRRPPRPPPSRPNQRWRNKKNTLPFFSFITLQEKTKQRKRMKVKSLTILLSIKVWLWRMERDGQLLSRRSQTCFPE